MKSNMHTWYFTQVLFSCVFLPGLWPELLHLPTGQAVDMIDIGWVILAFNKFTTVFLCYEWKFNGVFDVFCISCAFL